MKILALTLSLAAALLVARAGYANEEGGHHRRHHGHMPYMTSAQLSSVAALNLTEPQWKCFWRGVRKSTFEAARSSAGITKGEKPTKEQRQAMKAALKTSFASSLTAQLAVAPTESCPKGK